MSLPRGPYFISKKTVNVTCVAAARSSIPGACLLEIRRGLQRRVGLWLGLRVERDQQEVLVERGDGRIKPLTLGA